MAKQLKFTYDGIDYVLEYTRRSIETMERQGFVADNLRTKPLLTLPALFAGAFLAHHRGTKQKIIDDIYAQMKDKDLLIEKLAEMYNEPLEALMAEPDEKSGKLDWETSW